MPRQQFTGYFQRHDEVLTELEKATRRLRKLEAVYREFELQKVCYLPLNTFLLKPVQRLVHYRLLLGRLCGRYAPGHPDYADCHGECSPVADREGAARANPKSWAPCPGSSGSQCAVGRPGCLPRAWGAGVPKPHQPGARRREGLVTGGGRCGPGGAPSTHAQGDRCPCASVLGALAPDSDIRARTAC